MGNTINSQFYIDEIDVKKTLNYSYNDYAVGIYISLKFRVEIF